MKKNRILFAALASAVLVGCTDDNFAVVENNAAEGMNGKLVESGLFSVTRSEGAETRAFSPQLGAFVWMPTEFDAADDGSLSVNRLNQRVGFCWTGRNLKETQYSATTELKSSVFTNYEFEHIGWLEPGAEGPEGVECEEDELRNGAYIVGEGTPEATWGGTGWAYNSNPYLSKYYKTNAKIGTVKTVTGEYTWAGNTKDLDLANGIFRTNNASVFAGEYLIYYPYTDAFTKGEIVAEMPTKYDVEVQQGASTTDGAYVQDQYAASSDAAFALGYMSKYEGGNASSSFNAFNLNGFAGVILYNQSNSATAASNRQIKTVMLYSESTGIIYSQKINAAAAVNDLKDGSLNDMDNLFTAEKKIKNVVYANVTNDGVNPVIVEGTNKDVKGDGVKVVLPLFPQKIDDLKIILVDENDLTWTEDFSTFELTRNGTQIKEINLFGKTFTANYMVVDEPTLWSAWNKIYNSATQAGNIKMLNAIALEDVATNSLVGDHNTWPFAGNVTVNAPAPLAGADPIELTLTSNNRMSIKGAQANSSNIPTLTFNVPVNIQGAGCCEAEPAALVIGSMVGKYGFVKFSKKVTNNGTLVLNNNHTEKQKIEFDVLENALDKWAASNDKNKMTGAGEVYMLGRVDADLIIKEYNNKVTMGRKDEKMLAKTVVANTSVDMNSIFGTSATFPTVTLNAEDATTRDVTVDIETLNNDALFDIKSHTDVWAANFTNTEDAILKTYGKGYSTVDGRLNVDGNVSKNDKGIIDNQGVFNTTVKELNNTGLFVDRQSGQLGGKKVNNGEGSGAKKIYNGVTYTTDLPNEGMYVAQVETKDRMSTVLNDAVVEPSTNIVEILGIDGGHYNLFNYEDNMDDKDVIVNSPIAIAFKSYNKDNKAEKRFIGHCMTVLNGSHIEVNDGRLVLVKDLNVNKGGTFWARSKTSLADLANLMIQGNVTNDGKIRNGASYFQIAGNLLNNADGVFDSDTKFYIKGNVVTSGKFDSDGDENKVDGNFTQKAGDVTFVFKTTTTISGVFTAEGGTFEREGLDGTNKYRATVNVGTLGDVSNGSTTTAWPTEM